MVASAVVFVGPSLGSVRPYVSGVEYRAPAASGDVLAAARTGAQVIGLIDGVFYQTLAVTPREVRAAAAIGARLFGGASMGALRAVECPDAMTGIGKIYEAFTRGELTDDDEVAVTYDPLTFQVSAFPLVQVRAAVEALAARWPDARASLSSFLERIRALPFMERTEDRLAEAARALEYYGIRWPDVAATLGSDACDVKRSDALAVVNAVRDATSR